MTLPKKVAALILCVEAGYEPKIGVSGPTLTMQHDKLPTEPGFLMKTQVMTDEGYDYADVVMSIGSDEAWMFLIRHADKVSEQDVQEIMRQYKVSV